MRAYLNFMKNLFVFLLLIIGLTSSSVAHGQIDSSLYLEVEDRLSIVFSEEDSIIGITKLERTTANGAHIEAVTAIAVKGWIASTLPMHGLLVTVSHNGKAQHWACGTQFPEYASIRFKGDTLVMDLSRPFSLGFEQTYYLLFDGQQLVCHRYTEYNRNNGALPQNERLTESLTTKMVQRAFTVNYDAPENLLPDIKYDCRYQLIEYGQRKYGKKTSFREKDWIETGNEHWKGSQDLSFDMNSKWSKNNLYFTIWVHDDKVLTQPKDSERVVFIFYDGFYSWVNPKEDHTAPKLISLNIPVSEALVYSGNTPMPAIKVNKIDLDSGYKLKVKIPMSVLSDLGLPRFKPYLKQPAFTCSIDDYDRNDNGQLTHTRMSTSNIGDCPSCIGRMVSAPRVINHPLARIE